MKDSWVIPLAILAAGAIVASAVYLHIRDLREPASIHTVSANAIAPLSTADHLLGNPTAKIIIFEYSDFDCPPCKSFNAVLRQIVNDYGASREIAWVVRNIPLTELYPNARKHAEAAECVAKVGGTEAYFLFSDLLFAHQPADTTKYAEYAKKVGVSPESIASCIQQAATNGIDMRINTEREDALAAGARGAPFTIISVNGKPIVIDGAVGYAEVKDKIDTALSSVR